MKAETKTQYKVEGDGRMLGFQDAPQIFPCVEWMGWTWVTPIEALSGTTPGEMLQDSRQRVHAITPMPSFPVAQSRKGMNMTLSSLLLQPAKLNWHKEHARSLGESQSSCKILGRNFGLISWGISRDSSAGFPFPTLWFIKMALLWIYLLRWLSKEP